MQITPLNSTYNHTTKLLLLIVIKIQVKSVWEHVTLHKINNFNLESWYLFNIITKENPVHLKFWTNISEHKLRTELD